MTIAVSAVVSRSRWLFGMVIAMSACVAAVGCLIGLNGVGALNAVERIIIAAICLLAAIYVVWRAATSVKTAIIHVSGTGQIRISHWTNKSQAMVVAHEESIENAQSDVVHLLPISTLWSCLLILHLRHENGRTSIMTILPDSICANSFERCWSPVYGS
jgi:toxin CptA